MSFYDYHGFIADSDTLFGNVGFGIDHRQVPSEPTASLKSETVRWRLQRRRNECVTNDTRSSSNRDLMHSTTARTLQTCDHLCTTSTRCLLIFSWTRIMPRSTKPVQSHGATVVSLIAFVGTRADTRHCKRMMRQKTTSNNFLAQHIMLGGSLKLTVRIALPTASRNGQISPLTKLPSVCRLSTYTP
jgi:hypothetical protein